MDISDYSDEFCAGFLAGQVNALEESGLKAEAESHEDAQATKTRGRPTDPFDTVREALLPPYSGGKVWEGVGPTPRMDALAALAEIEERLRKAEAAMHEASLRGGA